MNVSLIYWNNDLKAELGSIRDQHITNFNSLKSSTNGLLNIIDNYKKVIHEFNLIFLYKLLLILIYQRNQLILKVITQIILNILFKLFLIKK